MTARTNNRGFAAKAGIIILALTVLICGLATVTTALAWDFHGIDMTDQQSVDLYFMDIDFEVDSIYTVPSTPNLPSPGVWSRENERVSLMFTFPNLEYTDKTTGEVSVVYVVTQAILNCPEGASLWWTFDARYDFTDKHFAISLSNNYYKYLESLPEAIFQMAVKDFQITMLYNNSGYAMYDVPWGVYKHNANISLRCEAADPGVFNPEDENFELNAGNTGDNTTPPPATDDRDNEGFDFIKWLADFLEQPVSVVKTVIIVILVGIIAFLLIKFIRWVFK